MDKCNKAPIEVQKLFRELLDNKREEQEDSELAAVIRTSLEQYAFEQDCRYYLGSQIEYDSGSGGTSSVDSFSAVGAINPSGSIPSSHHIGRSSSMMAPSSSTENRGGGIRGFFTFLGQSGSKSSVDITDLDPKAFPSEKSKQPRTYRRCLEQDQKVRVEESNLQMVPLPVKIWIDKRK
ncbi:hypothetical protein Cni_G28567 [Canna indica]|uniref:Uncharacterized protein n=1 Tax=Canna indica TaxID=4628 RepID=A0AAQ3L3L3_9LILI|nr:hypothetical protein Cni_G28567 [Canna indica]